MRDFGRRNFGVGLLVVCVCLMMVVLTAKAAAASSVASGSSGSINGVIMDKNNVPVPHAQVELDNAATDEMKDITTTDDTGSYGFQAVEPGKYVVKITADGFLPWTLQDIIVQAGRTETLVRVKLRGR